MRIISPYTLKWLHGGSEHNDISALIRENYHQVYHASLSRCMPGFLVCMTPTVNLKPHAASVASHGTLYGTIP